MSHTLARQGPDILQFVRLTIVDYPTGGETVLPSEFQSSSIEGVIFGTCPPGQNSLGVLLFPVIAGGKVQLFQFVGGSPQQIAATVGLNALFPAMVKIGG